MTIRVGIDLGSISLKAALFSRDPQDAACFERQEHGLLETPGRRASLLDALD